MFTIIIPAKGRPLLAREALQSVLWQSFDNFEVIFSNNGADPEVRECVRDLVDCPSVQYVEQSTVLSMPDHWEALLGMATGVYVTILPDRSLLKQDALSELAQIHRSDTSPTVVTWPWDLYYDSGYVLQANCIDGDKVIDSIEVLLDSTTLSADYPMALPRGLNSSVSMEAIIKIKAVGGRVFSPINPDYSFAFDCLLTQPQIVHLGRSLMISQGLNVSNGGNGYFTDASKYVSTLSLENPIEHSPIKSLFIENIIFEDLFAALMRHHRGELLDRIDIANLYLKCFSELNVKKAAGALKKDEIDALETELGEALAREPESVIKSVKQHRKARITLLARLLAVLKRIAGQHIEVLRRVRMIAKRANRFDSAMLAAGHMNAVSRPQSERSALD